MEKIVLRMDDVGASTKHFEVYSKKIFGNFLFLKYLPYFRAWPKYNELSVFEWSSIIELLINSNAKLTLGVTACWVHKDSSLISFPEKFPEQAEILKQAQKDGIIEIANHGLTHCVIGEHLPKFFTSNRKYHREFWNWIPRQTHFEHIERSQKIFREWLGLFPQSFIPPGNVYSEDTLEAAHKNSILLFNSSVPPKDIECPLKYVNEANVDAFHDKEVSLVGISWLQKKIQEHNNKEFKLLSEIC